MIKDFFKARVNCTDQQFYVEGPSKPGTKCILFVHGGPGWSLAPYCHQYLDILKEEIICIHWDQRGIWNSFDNSLDLSKVTIDDYIKDMSKVIDLLKQKYNFKKISLSGHSWGTILTTIYANLYPEQIDLVANVGQVGVLSKNETEIYDKLLTLATDAQDADALKFLQSIEDTSDISTEASMAMRGWSCKYNGQSFNFNDEQKIEAEYRKDAKPPYVSLACNKQEYEKADPVTVSAITLWPLIKLIDFRDINSMEVPFYIFQGRNDLFTAHDQAKLFFDSIKGNKPKEFFSFKECSHWVQIERKTEFTNFLILQLTNS